MPVWIGRVLLAFLPMLKDLFFKILAALGVSFVSYKGLGELLDRILGHFQSAYSALPPDLLALAGLAGIGTALNILFGAFNLCIGIFVTGKALKFFGKS